MSSKLFSIFFFSCCLYSVISTEASVDFELSTQEFVLETRKIEIPGHPHAFNPSIIKLEGSYLMSFRELPPPYYYSRIGLIWLDDHFMPTGKPYFIDFNRLTFGSEDARLVTIGDKLYMVYSGGNVNFREYSGNSYGGCRVCITEIKYDGNTFQVENNECLSSFEGENPRRREKNWVPFDYNGNMLLAYSILPHRILRPLLGTGECETFESSIGDIDWDWGELRGGTPAIRDEDHFLAFFHSTIDLPSIHSDRKTVPHYFIGAYTFSSYPPFAITHISKEPIVGKSFYSGRSYIPYWHPVVVVFPCGLFVEEDFVWMTYGRQDHEIWFAKIDKQKLLQSLAPVTTL